MSKKAIETEAPCEQAPVQHTGNSRSTEEQRTIQEAVRWTRLLVVTVFVLCAAVVGSLTYVVVSDRQHEDYQKQVSLLYLYGGRME